MTPLDAAVSPKAQPEAPLAQQKHALDEVRLDSTPKFYETAHKGQARPEAPNEEPKKKGLVQMEPGHGTTPDKYTYNPNQRNDRLLSMEEGKTADGTRTHKKFGSKADKHQPRADGMTEETTLTGKDQKTVTRKFDSSVNSHGLNVETVYTEGKTSTTTRGFDPNSKNNKDGLKTEALKRDDKGNETTTATFKDGSRIEIVKAQGKEVSTKKFDKAGNEIKGDGSPKNPADKTPTADDKTPKADDKTPKSIDEQLKAYRAELEKGNDLPEIKRDKGPYTSLEEAVKKGSIKPMSPEEMLSEARRIRDRDFKEKGRDYYKEHEKLERYTKKEIDEKVSAKKVELEKAQPKEPPKELPKPPETEGGTDKPPKPTETKLNVANNGASPEFQAKVQAAVDALPDGAKKLLQDKGVSVAVAKEDPNGLLNAFTRNKSDANHTTLSISENVDRGSGGPVKTDDIDVRNAVAFAVQHTSDPALNKSPEFQSAIKADLAKMTDNNVKERVSKMLETPSGQEQLFGKLFGERYMSGDAHAQEIQKMFPESSKWLDGQINKKSTDKAEAVDAKEKQAQAERLAPPVEKIKQAMTPDIEADLKKYGLETDPAKIKQGIIDAIRSDRMPLGVMQKRADGDFPILAGYMGTGALSNDDQRQQILSEQQQRRAKWREEHPDAAKGDEFKQFQIGEILREKLGKERINAADALLKKLQPGS